MTESASPTFGEAAPRLKENGYRPVPLHYGRKNPIPLGWPEYTFREGDEQTYGAAGTGLLTGEVIGLDIDVRNEALAWLLRTEAETTLGAAPTRIGAPPKALLVYQVDGEPFEKLQTRGYRLPGDSPEDKAHRVEVLARGQQFVAFNKHPDTHKPYTWNGHGDPLTVPIGLLPSVTRAALVAFIKSADKILGNHGTPVGKLTQAECDADRADAVPHISNEKQRAADYTLLRSALEAIPNQDTDCDDWWKLAYAIKGALGEDGREDWLKWSARSSKNVLGETIRVWESAKPTSLGAGTIYRLAGQYGWKRPDTSVPVEVWPTPVNILVELAAPQFDASGMPDELARYPLLYASATGFDPSITLTAAVSAAAAALSDEFRICADSGTQWFQSSRLWFLTIAPPGAGKTPAQREMTHALRDLHTELSTEYERALAEWERMAKEAGDEATAGPRPPRPRVIVGDTTIEALADVLRDNPRGVYIVAEEFDSWLGSLDQYRSGDVGRDRGQWLSAFDGGPNTIERVKRGAMFVPNWGVSILTATTPAGLARLTKHLPTDGLLQRFIPVVGRRQQQPTIRPERSQLEAERARYAETLRRLWVARPRAHRGVVSLSHDARCLFETWLQENQKLQEALGSIEPALEAHIAKYSAFALRLALTFHAAQVVNRTHPEARDPAGSPVSDCTMRLAITFLRRASQHALALYLNSKGNSQAYDLARAIARLVLARKPEENAHGLARRDLIRRVSAYRDADERVQSTALGLLVDLGWLQVCEGGYQKSAPTRYAVNPKVPEMFAAQAERERERRALARERITESAHERRGQPSND